MTRNSIILLALSFFLLAAGGIAFAQDAEIKEKIKEAPAAFHVTKLPLPRFVSLGSGDVHVRSGPGLKYPIKWVYKKPGLPVEVMLEYEVWRKVMDIDGQMGWVHQRLISGRRTGILTPVNKDELVEIFQRPKLEAKLVARAESGAIVSLEECIPLWCRVGADGYKGWVQRKDIWGIYESELFD